MGDLIRTAFSGPSPENEPLMSLPADQPPVFLGDKFPNMHVMTVAWCRMCNRCFLNYGFGSGGKL